MSRVPTIKFLQRIKNATKRNLVYQVTKEVWNTPDCSHFEYVTVKYVVLRVMVSAAYR